MIKRHWILREEKSGFDYKNYADFEISPLVAKILHNRGFCNYDSIHGFLNPSMKNIHDPNLLPNINAAAKRLKEAIEKKEEILLFGDYDVDGITGSSILHKALAAMGANVTAYIPNRFIDGYGISVPPLERIFEKSKKPTVVISIDNGVVAFEAANFLNHNNVDFIVADHHRMNDDGTLPEAIIVHPRIPGSEYPNGNLCGAGVSFKLAWQTARLVSGSDRLPEYYRNLFIDLTALVAMGTIADIMPLTDENRTLVAYGLKQLERTTESGLRSLVDSSKVKFPLRAGHVSYHVAPRINAAGRLGIGKRAFDLLVSKDYEKAVVLAKELESENDIRREIEAELTDNAFAQVRHIYGDKPTMAGIVVADENWHEGVVGIVASRVAETFHKPSLVLSVLEDGESVKGSGRAALGVDMKLALDDCGDLLDKYGGHEAAVGLSMKRENLEDFRTRFAMAVARQLGYDTPEIDAIDELKIDSEINLRDLGYDFLKNLEKLEPFGMGNKKPIFSATVKLAGEPILMGKQKNHLSFSVEQDEKVFKAVMWKRGDLFTAISDFASLPIPHSFRIAFRPEFNNFRGKTSIQLNAIDILLPDIVKTESELEQK